MVTGYCCERHTIRLHSVVRVRAHTHTHTHTHTYYMHAHTHPPIHTHTHTHTYTLLLFSSRKDPRYLDTHRHPSHTLAHHLSEHFPSSDMSTQLCVVGKPLVIKTPYPRILPEEHHKKLQGVSLFTHPDLHTQKKIH